MKFAIVNSKAVVRGKRLTVGFEEQVNDLLPAAYAVDCDVSAVNDSETFLVAFRADGFASVPVYHMIGDVRHFAVCYGFEQGAIAVEVLAVLPPGAEIRFGEQFVLNKSGQIESHR